MINIEISPVGIKQLGDRIVHCRFAHMFSVYNNVKVNLMFRGRELQTINDMFTYGDVICNADWNGGKAIEGYETIHINNNFLRPDFHDAFIRLVDEVPHTITDKKLKPQSKLPSGPYITTQWDAQGMWREMPEEQIKEIEDWYKKQGYSIVRLSGNFAKSLPLDEIFAIIQGAELHAGCDSGMMHAARLVLPSEKVHMYINLKYRADIKTPNHQNLSLLAREAIRSGVKLNPIDNVSPEEYSNIDVWYNFCSKQGYMTPTPDIFPYNTGKWKLGPEPKNFKHEGIPDIPLQIIERQARTGSRL